jgi:23S rRNA (cytidine1920-2'-O)/16S rRNA (cytidine1409-2'-O)-methyltransferase
MRMRLDAALVARGLTSTRARARDLIQRGFVSRDGAVCLKPAANTQSTQSVALSALAPAYVSRGAEKLAHALAVFEFSATGRIALDIGASTGGFTEVLLEAGVARVFAVDVGHGQLNARIATDQRVTVLENTDARALDVTLVPDPITAIVADVSFISLSKAMPAALRLASRDAWLVALIKPQFEVGPNHIARGGIVRDAAAVQGCICDVEAWIARQPGWSTTGIVPSPILGGSGNAEFLIGAIRRG